MKRKGFTLIELLVVIAIIAILAAILFPVFVSAREKGKQASCISNLKQLAFAMTEYTQEHGDTFPINDPVYYGNFPQWVGYSTNGIFNRYVKNKKIYQCPSAPGKKRPDTGEFYMGYGFNAYLTDTDWYYFRGENAVKFSVVLRPSRVILMADQKVPFSYDLHFNFAYPFYRHNDGANFSFVDGHAKWYNKSGFDTSGSYSGAGIEAQGIKFYPYPLAAP